MQEPMIVRVGVRGYLIYSASFLGFSGVGFFMLTAETRLFYRSIGALNMLLGMLALLVMLWSLRKPLFILDRTGVYVPKLRAPTLFIPWREIISAECSESKPMITIYVRHPEKYASIDRLGKRWGMQPQNALILNIQPLSQARRKAVCDYFRHHVGSDLSS